MKGINSNINTDNVRWWALEAYHVVGELDVEVWKARTKMVDAQREEDWVIQDDMKG